MKDKNSLNRDLIFHYMDLAGMVTVKRNPDPASTLNGLMHTGLYMCFLKNLDLLDFKAIEAFYDTVKSCEEVPGVYDRYPSYSSVLRNNLANAHDDAAGVFAGSKVCNLVFHKDILAYGKTRLFTYNNQIPGLFFSNANPLKWEWWSFRLRFLDHITWYFIANNKLTALTPLLMTYIACKTLASTTANSGRLLTYMQVESLSHDNWLWKKFKKWFLPKSKLKEAASNYFKSDNGYDHPIVTMAELVEKQMS